MEIRTRFAPSPTGYLHIGVARTALFAWLFARNKKGKFILRIEDTDLARSTTESTDGILQAMEWLGLDYDEGPIFQSDRFDRYKEVLEQLLEQKLAYYCSCSKERLNKLREEQLANKQKPKYDNSCRDKDLSSSSDTVIRLRNPLKGKVVFKDEVYGEVSFDNEELDDLILQRSDGTPTYNLTVTVDDHDMKISHVVRGDDHLNNTPRQINLGTALGMPIPIFAHLPMILNEEGKKLSKRYDAVNVMGFKDDGILPEAMLNYLVRLGWSHGDKEVFTKDEMFKLFDLNGVNRAPATYNKTKLLWMNKQYIQNFSQIDYIKELERLISKIGGDVSLGPQLQDILEVFASRSQSLLELAKDCLFLYLDNVEHNIESADKVLISKIKIPLTEFVEQLELLENWHVEEIKVCLKAIIKSHGLKFPELAQAVRIAITGDTSSPSIDKCLYLLGKDRACHLLTKAIISIDSAQMSSRSLY